MRKLMVFENVTVDGYFADKNGDFSWVTNGNVLLTYVRPG